MKASAEINSTSLGMKMGITEERIQVILKPVIDSVKKSILNASQKLKEECVKISDSMKNAGSSYEMTESAVDDYVKKNNNFEEIVISELKKVTSSTELSETEKHFITLNFMSIVSKSIKTANREQVKDYIDKANSLHEIFDVLSALNEFL